MEQVFDLIISTMRNVIFLFFLISCVGNKMVDVSLKGNKVVFKVKKRGSIIIAKYYGYPIKAVIDSVPIVKPGKYDYDYDSADVIAYVFVSDSVLIDTDMYIIPKRGLSEFLKLYLTLPDTSSDFIQRYADLRIKYPNIFAFYYDYISALYEKGKVDEESIRDSLDKLFKKFSNHADFLLSACEISLYILEDSTNRYLDMLKLKYPTSIHRIMCEMERYFQDRNYDSILKFKEYLGRFHMYPEFRRYIQLAIYKKSIIDTGRTYIEDYLKAIPKENRFAKDYDLLTGIYSQYSDTIRLKSIMDTLESVYSSDISEIKELLFFYNLPAILTIRNYKNRNFVYRVLREKFGRFYDLKYNYYLMTSRFKEVYESLLPVFRKEPTSLDYYIGDFIKASLNVGDTLSYLKASAYAIYYYGDTSYLRYIEESLKVSIDSLRKLVKFDTVKAFRAITLDGDTITKEDLRGKTAVINFWATWCGPCRREIPHLNSLVDKFSHNSSVIFIAISDENPVKVKRFVEKNEFKYIVCAGGKDMFKEYNIYGIPVHMIISPSGYIVFRRIGSINSPEELENHIRRHIRL